MRGNAWSFEVGGRYPGAGVLSSTEAEGGRQSLRLRLFEEPAYRCCKPNPSRFRRKEGLTAAAKWESSRDLPARCARGGRRLLRLSSSPYRRASSSIVEASVFSSRYFTITGAYSEILCCAANSPDAGREPGTRTAPVGIVKGVSVVFRYTCPRTRS